MVKKKIQYISDESSSIFSSNPVSGCEINTKSINGSTILIANYNMTINIEQTTNYNVTRNYDYKGTEQKIHNE